MFSVAGSNAANASLQDLHAAYRRALAAGDRVAARSLRGRIYVAQRQWPEVGRRVEVVADGDHVCGTVVWVGRDDEGLRALTIADDLRVGWWSWPLAMIEWWCPLPARRHRRLRR